MSRKQQNLLIEKKIRNRRKISQLIFAGVVLVIIGVIGYFIWDAQDRRWIVNFEGTRVSTNDFRFLAAEMNVQVNEQTRDWILRELYTTLIIEQRAKEHGLTLTDSQQDELMSAAQFIRLNVQLGQNQDLYFINDERIAELLAPRFIHAAELMEYYVEYPDEENEEFIEAFDTFVHEASWQFERFEVMYVNTWTREEIEEILYQLIEEEVPLEEIVGGLIGGTSNFDEDGNPSPMELTEFINTFGLFMHEHEIRVLAEGEWSGVLQAGEIFFAVQMFSREDADIDEMREVFINNQRNSTFLDMLEDWIENADFTINERVFYSF